MAREIVETLDFAKVVWGTWHCVTLDLSNTDDEHDQQISEWLDHDENARGDWCFGRGRFDFMFSEANTALAFKLRFG